MRRLLLFLLMAGITGCSDSEPASEPVAEKRTEAPPAVPKAKTQPVVAPTHPVTRPDPPAVVEKPELAIFQAPGKVPLLVSVRTKSGKKHVGEVLERTDSGLVLYDIVLRGTVTIPKDQTKSIIEGIDEGKAGFHVPFATYGAWKLTKLLRAGKVQGQITMVSEQGLFINLGSTAGLVAGQTIKLLGQAESIMDPETEKVLAVFRPTLATLLVSQVMNADVSKVTLNSPESSVSIKRGMVVECERLPRTVVLIPPQWESGDPNLKTGDEALYLTEHVLTELVRNDIPVISQDQVSRIRAEIASRESQEQESVSGIAIAEEVQADVVLTGKLLAKGRTGNVTLHVTDVPTTRLVGVLTGRIRRDKIKDESEKAKKVAVVVMKGGNRINVLAKRIGITPAMAGSLLLAMPFDQETVRVTGRTIQVRDISAYNRHGIGGSATIATVEQGVRG